jgi:hypothetical protein
MTRLHHDLPVVDDYGELVSNDCWSSHTPAGLIVIPGSGATGHSTNQLRGADGVLETGMQKFGAVTTCGTGGGW